MSSPNKRKKKKRGNGLLYVLVVLSLLASAFAAWGLMARLGEYQESNETYQELQQEVASQSEQQLTGQAQTQPEEELVSEGLEDQETDQEETIWFITEVDSARVQQAVQPAAQDGSVAGVTPRPAFQQATAVPAATGGDAVATPMPMDGDAAVPSTTIAGDATGTYRPVATPQPASTEGSRPEVTAEAIAGETTTLSEATAAPHYTEEPAWQRFVDMDQVRHTVNFSYLETLNEDVVAWLRQEGTDIDYPVMQGENNNYYLNHMFNRKTNEDGSLFIDVGNSTDFIDANTYIYGHNTKVGSMFGSLSNYQDQAYYQAHPQLILLTPYSDFCIDIFACTMSLVEDEESWRVKQFKRKAEFEEYLRDLQSRSFIQSDNQPVWGDQWLILVTCTNVRHGERYVVYGRMRPIRYGTEEAVNITKVEMDEKPTISGVRNVGTLGEMQVYVQNDPLWQNIRFERRGSSKKRPFGDGGAGPTVVATAIANLIPKQDLPKLTGYSGATAGFTFCTHSVNQYYCNRLHAQYQIQTPDEFERYLPMAMASFATGNNLWEEQSRTEKSGTGMRFMEYVAGVYGLSVYPVEALYRAEHYLDQCMMVCSVAAGKNPFARGSHYVLLAGTDEEYLYFIDPYLTDRYTADRNHILEIIDQNVVRVKREHLADLGINAFYILLEQGTKPEL